MSKAVRKSITVVLIVMAVLTTLLFIADNLGQIERVTAWATGNPKLGPRVEARIDSFLMSWLEDVCFFVGFGLFFTLISRHSPDRDHINERIGYVANADCVKGHQNFQDYIVSEIKKLGAISRTCRCVLTVLSFDENLNAYKVDVKFDMVLANTFADYTNDKLVCKAYARADLVDCEVLGEIHSATAVSGVTTTQLIAAPEQLTKDRSSIEKNFEMTIEKNSHVNYSFHFWVWAKVGECQTTEVERYTDVLSINVVSMLSDGRAVVISAPTREPRTGRLRGASETAATANVDSDIIINGKTKNQLDFLEIGPAHRVEFVWRAPRAAAEAPA